MSRAFTRRISGSIATLAVLASTVSGCAEQARPLASQEAAAGTEASRSALPQVCGTESNPCAIEGITVVVPRSG